MQVQRSMTMPTGAFLARNLTRATRLTRRYSQRMLQRTREATMRCVMGTITHVATRDAVVALTFDDGPHPEFTPELLDVLARHRARGTFFMLGEAARRHPVLVRQIAQAGHAIGNHSWNHPSFPLITSRERKAQIQACAQALAPFGQPLFRPPYGEQHMASRLDALLLHFEVVTWNRDVGDWWDRDVDRMATLLADRVRPGDIVVLHDALYRQPEVGREPTLAREPNMDRRAMLAALDMFLEQAADRFRFLTVPELLRHGRPCRMGWYQTTQPA